mmetsp:Transcript_50662/g.99056  ORF Transcript_50662/g.99056 Transcript_50662/m.99056 type:complete len:88 (+) Transcript_50662:525-788(+)
MKKRNKSWNDGKTPFRFGGSVVVHILGRRTQLTLPLRKCTASRCTTKLNGCQTLDGHGQQTLDPLLGSIQLQFLTSVHQNNKTQVFE